MFIRTLKFIFRLIDGDAVTHLLKFWFRKRWSIWWLCILLKTELCPHCSRQVCIYNLKSSSVMRWIFQHLIVIFEAPSDKIIIWPISRCPADCGTPEVLMELWHFTQLHSLMGPDPGLLCWDIFNEREGPAFAMVSCILCPLIGKHYYDGQNDWSATR